MHMLDCIVTVKSLYTGISFVCMFVSTFILHVEKFVYCHLPGQQ